MKDDREQVLASIRASLKHTHLPTAQAQVPPRAVGGQGDAPQHAQDFIRELEAVGGIGYVVTDDEAAIELVLKIAQEAGGKQILAWGDADLPVRGVGAALDAAGYTRMDGGLPKEPEARHARLLELEHAAIGITGALAGLVDTGSLALLTSPSRTRLASLLPPTHIALLPLTQLYPSLASFFAAFPDLTRDSSNLAFVTGPSRTADIEMTLTRGVHGPKFVHVILIQAA